MWIFYHQQVSFMNHGYRDFPDILQREGLKNSGIFQYGGRVSKVRFSTKNKQKENKIELLWCQSSLCCVCCYITLCFCWGSSLLKFSSFEPIFFLFFFLTSGVLRLHFPNFQNILENNLTKHWMSTSKCKNLASFSISMVLVHFWLKNHN